MSIAALVIASLGAAVSVVASEYGSRSCSRINFFACSVLRKSMNFAMSVACGLLALEAR